MSPRHAGGNPLRARLTSLLIGLSVACALVASAEPPSVEAFFELPTFETPRLSPSGEHVAIIMQQDDSYLILVRELRGQQFTPIVKFTDSSFRPRRLIWANDDRLLISGVYRSRVSVGVRARATQLYGVDRDGENLKYLAKRWPKVEYIQLQDQFLHLLPEDPKHVLLQLWKPGDSSPSVYRLNVYSGSLRRIVRPLTHVYTWVADEEGAIRLGYGLSPPMYTVIARTSAEAEFETIAEFSSTEGQGLSVLGFTRNPAKILVTARRERANDPAGDRMAVYEYSLETKQFGDLVLEHDRVDVDGTLLYRPGTHEPVAIEYWVDGRELHFLDEKYAALQRGLDAALPSRDNFIVDATADGRVLLVASSAPDVAPQIYVVMRDQGEAFQLLSMFPDLEGVMLGQPRAIRYLARDGREIHGFLTLPPGSAGKNLPAVLMPHGGPWSRDTPLVRPPVAVSGQPGIRRTSNELPGLYRLRL